MRCFEWLWGAALIVMVTGCSAVPASIKSQQVGKVDRPVRDLAVVYVEGQGTARLGLSAGGKLAEELQRLRTP